MKNLKSKKNIGIVITHDCNQQCSYCFETKQKRVITKEVIDKISEKIENKKDNTIYLWGGEPFLQIELCNYIGEKFDKCNLFLSTNGTIFNGEINDFIEKNKKRLTLQISLDGLPNGERPLEQITIENLDKFKSLINFNIQATITSKRIRTLIEDFFFLKEHSFNIRHKLLDNPEIYTEEDLLLFLQEWKELKRIYRSMNYKHYLQMFHYVIKKVKKHFCSAGITEITFDIDGKVYPCLTAANKKIIELKNDKDFENWFNFNKLSSISDVFCSYADCFNCILNKDRKESEQLTNFAKELIKINEGN